MFKKFFYLLAVGLLYSAHSGAQTELRIGLIGLDTSHAPAFSRLLNDSTNENYLRGARIVAAFPGGSPDVEASYTRIERFTHQVRDEFGVEIVNDIPTLLKKVDAVILTSVDGRVHLAQATPVLKAGIPLFIDKPMAASLQTVREIFRLSDEYGTPCFSASSLRFLQPLQDALEDTVAGKIIGCIAYSPCKFEPHHPDLMWYGIHGIEMLFTAMGPGCTQVTRIHSEDTDVVVGLWKDGRIATFRGIRDGKSAYGIMLFGDKDIIDARYTKGALYKNLLIEVLEFFRTGKSPVPRQETLEMFAFMEAADESKDLGGQVVRLDLQ
jgi:predicted dehydrogenase